MVIIVYAQTMLGFDIALEALWKVMDWSNASFHGLLNVIYNQVLASKTSFVYAQSTLCAKRKPCFLWKVILVLVYE